MLLGLLALLSDAALYVLYAPFRPTASPRLGTTLGAAPAPPSLHASAFLITVDGTALAGQNTHLLHPSASTVKLLTALVAVQDPNLPPDRVITATAEDVQAARAGYAQGDSVLLLTPGERLTVHDLLLALLLPSADNAADMLAAASSLGRTGFLKEMYRESKRLRLGSPPFGDPSGLSAQDQLSPWGAVRLAEAALKNPVVRSIVRLQTARLSNGQTLENLDQLLGTYRGALGLKTGYTPAAGYMLVFAATRNGHTAIGSLMGEPDMPQVFADARALLDWAFSTVPLRTIGRGSVVATLKWPGGAEQVLRLTRSVAIPYAAGSSFQYRLGFASPERLAAGGDVGWLVLKVPGGGAQRIPLYTAALGAWPRLLARLVP